MLPHDSLSAQATQIKEWGFEGIAVFADYETWSDDSFEELYLLERRTGIKPCEFAFSSPLYGHLMDDDLDLRQKSRNMYRKAIEICKEIGAITEIEYAYGPQEPLPLFQPYQQMIPSQEAEFLSMYTEFAQLLEGTTACVLIEGINRYESPYMNCLSDCANVVRKVNHPNAGVLADFFHMSIEEIDIARSISETGSLIKHIHLGENNRLLPGYGNINWKDCLRALKGIGYEGYLNLECSTCGDVKNLSATADFLKAII
jgi:sugar phosphate isomerase/epimerase